MVLIGFPDIYKAGDHIPDILSFGPIGLEGLDYFLIENIHRKGGPHRKYLPMLPKGKGWLLVEFGYETQEEAAEQARKMMEAACAESTDTKLFVDKTEQAHVWEVRESALGATAFVPF
jgi:hypothetical protein